MFSMVVEKHSPPQKSEKSKQITNSPALTSQRTIPSLSSGVVLFPTDSDISLF